MPDDDISREAMDLAVDIAYGGIGSLEGARRIDALCKQRGNGDSNQGPAPRETQREIEARIAAGGMAEVEAEIRKMHPARARPASKPRD